MPQNTERVVQQLGLLSPNMALEVEASESFQIKSTLKACITLCASNGIEEIKEHALCVASITQQRSVKGLQIRGIDCGSGTDSAAERLFDLYHTQAFFIGQASSVFHHKPRFQACFRGWGCCIC